MVNGMAAADVQPDEIDTPEPLVFELRTTGWDRSMAALRMFVISVVVAWLVVGGLLYFLWPGKLRPRPRNRIAIAVALPVALGLAVRRYLRQYHRLTSDGEWLSLQNNFRTVTLDPLQVQGIVGAGGINFDSNDTLVWKHLVLIADGRRHVFSFDKDTNAEAYQQLRVLCIHAWGLPYEGTLETPLAGPELDPEEYVDALRHVRRYYRLHTQKSAVVGLLLIGGSVATGLGIAFSVAAAKFRPKLYFWLLLIGFVGLLVTVRAVRQVPVLLSIRNVERRLSETL